MVKRQTGLLELMFEYARLFRLPGALVEVQLLRDTPFGRRTCFIAKHVRDSCIHRSRNFSSITELILEGIPKECAGWSIIRVEDRQGRVECILMRKREPVSLDERGTMRDYSITMKYFTKRSADKVAPRGRVDRTSST